MIYLAVDIKKYNGSSWVRGSVKKYNGSSWEEAYVYKYDGTKWVQIYPETPITTTETVIGSGYSTYKLTWATWDAGDAKQGSGANYDGSTANWGYLGILSTAYSGCGSVSSVSSATFAGTRGDAGTYNSNQTIKFYRCSVPSSGTPTTSNIAGNFTCSTNGPGKNTSFSNKTISGISNVQDFMNQTSYKYLYIYSNATADYLDLNSAQLTVTYTYLATTVAYETTTSMISLCADTPSTLIGKDSLLKMVIYNNELDYSLDEIFKRRENGVVQDIDIATVNDADYIIKPWTRLYEIQKIENEERYIARIEAFNLGMDDEVQMSLNKTDWITMYQTNPNTQYMEANLPLGYNRVFDWVYVQIINKKTKEVYCTKNIEPMFIV